MRFQIEKTEIYEEALSNFVTELKYPRDHLKKKIVRMYD